MQTPSSSSVCCFFLHGVYTFHSIFPLKNTLKCSCFQKYSCFSRFFLEVHCFSHPNNFSFFYPEFYSCFLEGFFILSLSFHFKIVSSLSFQHAAFSFPAKNLYPFVFWPAEAAGGAAAVRQRAVGTADRVLHQRPDAAPQPHRMPTLATLTVHWPQSFLSLSYFLRLGGPRLFASPGHHFS